MVTTIDGRAVFRHSTVSRNASNQMRRLKRNASHARNGNVTGKRNKRNASGNAWKKKRHASALKTRALMRFVIIGGKLESMQQTAAS